MTLPATADERWRLHQMSSDSWYAAPAAIDRYLLPGPALTANPPAAAVAVDRRDRQTDGRTSDRYIYTLLRTLRAAE